MSEELTDEHRARLYRKGLRLVFGVAAHTSRLGLSGGTAIVVRRGLGFKPTQIHGGSELPRPVRCSR